MLAKATQQLRRFGIREGRMMTHDAIRPPWKLLAQLFGELGRISKIGVVNIDVLRDDRFDPSADAISCPSPLDPDWPEQFVEVAGLNLRDGEFSDRRVGAPFERRRPLRVDESLEIKGISHGVGTFSWREHLPHPAGSEFQDFW